MYKLINVTVFRPFTAPAAEKQLDDFQDYLEAETHGIENGNCDQLYPCEISFANILSEVTNYNQYLQNFQANFTDLQQVPLYDHIEELKDLQNDIS